MAKMSQQKKTGLTHADIERNIAVELILTWGMKSRFYEKGWQISNAINQIHLYYAWNCILSVVSYAKAL